MDSTVIRTAPRIAAGIIRDKAHLAVGLVLLLFPIGLLLQAHAQNSRRSEPPLKATADSAAAGPTGSEFKGALPKAIVGYTQTLRQLAERAQEIVRRLPQKPEAVSQGFQDLEKVLTQSRDVLIEILNRKEAIRAEKERVLQSAALVQQAFADKGFQIDNEIDQLRRSSTTHPKATEAVIQGLTSAAMACERGQRIVTTVREQLLKDSAELDATLAELQHYPMTFQRLIDVAQLYATGLGEPADYEQMVKAIWEAREHLRSIIYALAQAAEAAETAVKSMPSVPSGPATPLPQVAPGTAPPIPNL